MHLTVEKTHIDKKTEIPQRCHFLNTALLRPIFTRFRLSAILEVTFVEHERKIYLVCITCFFRFYYSFVFLFAD